MSFWESQLYENRPTKTNLETQYRGEKWTKDIYEKYLESTPIDDKAKQRFLNRKIPRDVKVSTTSQSLTRQQFFTENTFICTGL